MRLSSIQGDRVYDVIADCISPIANIAADPKASRLFRRETVPKGMDTKEFVKIKVVDSAPTLLKEHKKDLTKILATIEGVSEQEYSSTLTLAKLIADLIDLLTDETFMGLFTSAQSKTGGSSSGSAQENTEGRSDAEPLSATA